MIFKVIYILIAMVAGACSYRVGGMSKKSAKKKIPWFPQVLVRGWFRDINCTLITLGYYVLFMPLKPWWVYVLSGLAMWGAMTTYWDRI